MVYNATVVMYECYTTFAVCLETYRYYVPRERKQFIIIGLQSVYTDNAAVT